MDPNEIANSQNVGLSQFGFNMDEIISRSKVYHCLNKSNNEIQNARILELQKISDIVINENVNLKELNKKGEKFNLRNENKLQMSLKSQGSLITDMIQVTESFRKLKSAIDELEANKINVEQRNSEIDLIWKTVNDIDLEIQKLNHTIRLLHEDIRNVQSNIEYEVIENDMLKTEYNKMSGEVVGVKEIFAKLENIIANLQHEFMIEKNENSNLTDKRNEFQRLVEEKTSNFIEMKQQFKVLLNDTIAKKKIDFEKEIENENLIKINMAKKIADGHAADELEMKKCNDQIYQTENLIRENEIYKNKFEEQRKLNDLKKVELINVEKSVMEKLQRIEGLTKNNSELKRKLQQKEFEYNQLDEVHEKEKNEIQHMTNLEIHELTNINRDMMLEVDALRKAVLTQSEESVARRKKRITLPQRSQTASRDSYSERILPSFSQPTVREQYGNVPVPQSNSNRLSNRNKPTLVGRSSDESSFLSNMSLESGVTNQFKLPTSLLKPLEPRTKVGKKYKYVGIPKPLVEDPFSSSDSS